MATEITTEMPVSGGLSVPLILPHKSNGWQQQPGVHHRASKKAQITRSLTLKNPNILSQNRNPDLKFRSTKQLEVSSSSIKDSKHLILIFRSLPQNAPEMLRSGKIRRNRERLKTLSFNWYGESGPMAIREFGVIARSSMALSKIRELARGQRGGIHFMKRESSIQLLI